MYSACSKTTVQFSFLLKAVTISTETESFHKSTTHALKTVSALSDSCEVVSRYSSPSSISLDISNATLPYYIEHINSEDTTVDKFVTNVLTYDHSYLFICPKSRC